VIITAFPCGPDSLAGELIMRKKNEIPTVNIVLDELSNDAGVQTRIESFIDIISARAANKG
jgi:predicted nucleotide-binding protein (sugar kinase/HSP70/actin superfamily)